MPLRGSGLYRIFWPSVKKKEGYSWIARGLVIAFCREEER